MLATGLVGVAYWTLAHWAARRPSVFIGYVPGLSAALRWLLPRRMRAVTVWTFVILLRVGERLTLAGKAHELVHVQQFRRWPATFPFRYLWATIVDGGYRANRYERQARGER